MFCPSCGTKTSTEQKFCRSCGLSLEQVSEVVATRHLTKAEQLALEHGAERSPQQRLMEGLASIGAWTMVGGGVVLVGLLLYKIISNFILARGEVLLGSALLLLLLGAVLLLSYVIYNETQKEKTKPKKLKATAAAGQTTDKLLAEAPTPILASVTEPTTQLLEPAEPSPVPHARQAEIES